MKNSWSKKEKRGKTTSKRLWYRVKKKELYNIKISGGSCVKD
jgi:hypothetical protein